MRRDRGDLRDPEFDEPETGDVDTSGCVGGRCDGTGFVRVSQRYVDRHAPMPNLPEPTNDAEQHQYDAIMHEAAMVRAALANSSYPCPSCRPELFFRWQRGCLGPNHNIEKCVECSVARGVAPKRRRRAREEETPDELRPASVNAEPPPTPPPRLDID